MTKSKDGRGGIRPNPRAEAETKWNRRLRIGAGAAVAAAVILLVVSRIAGGSGDAGSVGDLVIPLDGVSETAAFFPVSVDGVDMEILAVRAPDGTVRTAFNTCQVCYSSGRGYYAQSGGELVCQNCGNRFQMGQVEIESGGCNPWPIFAADKTVAEESITISYDFLRESKEIFSNWKTAY